LLGKVQPTLGLWVVCSNFMHTKFLGYAYETMRCMISSILFMMNHVEEIMHPRGNIIRSYKLVIIGQPYIDMLNNTLHIVMNVKEWGNLKGGMRFLYSPEYHWDHFTSGSWNS
jgi:hypothetical protein